MMNGTKIVYFTQNRINLEIFDKETQDFAMEAKYGEFKWFYILT